MEAPLTPPVPLAALTADRELGLRLLAGPADADVYGVHASEMADPSPYLLGGELLLTAGAGLAGAAAPGTAAPGTGEAGTGVAPGGADPGDPGAPGGAAPADPAEYVARLVRAGVGAVGFGVTPVHETVPPALVEACERYGLPLVEVPPGTPFTAVGRAVWRLMAEARTRELRRVTEAQQSLASAAARPHPVAAVLSRLAASLNGWAALLTPPPGAGARDGAVPGPAGSPHTDATAGPGPGGTGGGPAGADTARTGPTGDAGARVAGTPPGPAGTGPTPAGTGTARTGTAGTRVTGTPPDPAGTDTAAAGTTRPGPAATRMTGTGPTPAGTGPAPAGTGTAGTRVAHTPPGPAGTDTAAAGTTRPGPAATRMTGTGPAPAGTGTARTGTAGARVTATAPGPAGTAPAGGGSRPVDGAAGAGADPGEAVRGALAGLAARVAAGGVATATDTLGGTHLAAYAVGGGRALALATPSRAPGDHTIASVAAVLLTLLTASRPAGDEAASLTRLLLDGDPAAALSPGPWYAVHARGGGDPRALAAALGTVLLDPRGDGVRLLTDRDPAPQPGWRLGVSAPAAPAGLGTAGAQARRALERAEAARTPLARHTEPGLAGLVGEAEARAHAEALLGPLSPALRDTLRAWLAHHGSWDRTAAVLGVHRNTVRQRVARAAGLLGIDPDDPDTRMELWFALRHEPGPKPPATPPPADRP
ncbi:helix-turn-helix domain-containing protein [Streptomyces sp. NPDC059104]|uniref:helix-turn-helix domain-containing protein n=1 Tax=Streptomyces sp. NPDC059104 TaxID=3346729 RepID=UPI003689F767